MDTGHQSQDYDWEKIYKEVYAKVRGFILRNKGRKEDVGDMLQEAMTITYEKVVYENIDLRGNPGAFIFTVAKNKWLQELNKRRVKVPKKYQLNQEDVYRMADLNLLHQLTPTDDPGVLPEVELEEEKRWQKLINDYVDYALQQKSSLSCRKLLLAKIVEDLTLADIANTFGYKNTDTVKTQIYKCKEKIRKYLKGIEVLKGVFSLK